MHTGGADMMSRTFLTFHHLQGRFRLSIPPRAVRKRTGQHGSRRRVLGWRLAGRRWVGGPDRHIDQPGDATIPPGSGAVAAAAERIIPARAGGVFPAVDFTGELTGDFTGDGPGSAPVWIGPDPADLAMTAAQLAERGVGEQVSDRADAAVVRAAAGTDADLFFLPGDVPAPREGIGATLPPIDEEVAAHENRAARGNQPGREHGSSGSPMDL